jgi:hypothetical protein
MPSSTGKKKAATKAATKAANKKYVDAGVRKELSKVNFKALAGMASEGPKKRKLIPGAMGSKRKSR